MGVLFTSEKEFSFVSAETCISGEWGHTEALTQFVMSFLNEKYPGWEQGRFICPGTYECFDVPTCDGWNYSDRVYPGRSYIDPAHAKRVDIRFLDGSVASQHPGRLGLKAFRKGDTHRVCFPITAGAVAANEIIVFPWVELDLHTSPVSVRLQYPDCIPEEWIPLPDVQILELDGVLGLISEVTEEDYALMQQRLEQYLKVQGLSEKFRFQDSGCSASTRRF